MQPIVLAVSPANGQTTVGTNATIAAKFSLPLNRATVVLSGGCFQNAVLTEDVECMLQSEAFTVLRARDIPPNDGGLAYGQHTRLC